LRASSERLTVTLDARALGPHVGGSQTYLLGLIESLALGGEIDQRVLVPPDLSGSTFNLLRTLPHTELLSYEQAVERPHPSHVVHRPQQVFSPDDLLLLRRLGTRLVITHYDLIAYHNPTYFPSIEPWERFVRTTREALAAADHVLFFSEHALTDAAREDLVQRLRCTVVHPGIAREQPSNPETAASAPSGLASRASTPFLLCIGADYQHKNRPFALALLDKLRREHGWPGVLVLAGPHVEHGSSKEDEERVRNDLSIPPAAVLDLSTVRDSERSWLMRSAAALVYPTVDEGFGLIPFEAAASGVPCLFAAQSSLRELLDTELATLVPWNPTRSAARAAPLLVEGDERREHVEGLVRAARRLTWTDCASATVAAYYEAVAAPELVSAEEAWQALNREREIVRLDQSVRELSVKVRELTDDLGSDGIALVGPQRLLSPSDQRVLLAVAARPMLRGALLGPLSGGFRIMRAARRLVGASVRTTDNDR
jgi:glycosyltransferase involved in cell wall biosynthesis